MRDFIRQYFPPIVFILIGLVLLIGALISQQNLWFKLAALGILVAGIVFLLTIIMKLGRVGNLLLAVGLGLASFGFLWLDYSSIKDKVDETAEWERRETYIVQRLKDIRAVQQAHKEVTGGYCADFDSLARFIETGKIRVIKAIGTVPDSLTEQEAVERGIVRRDTSFEGVLQSAAVEAVSADPKRPTPFNADSLRFVPYGYSKKHDTTAVFFMDAGTIERSGVIIPVFEAVDSAPFIDGVVRKVGSMTEPSTAGNWE